MSRRKIKAGSTSIAVPIFVQDTSSTAGAGLGSLTSASSGLVGKYRREGDNTWTSITLAAGTLGTWSSGGWVADGVVTGGYEVGVPDAALAAGAKWAQVVYQGATNMLPVLLEFELDAINYQDGVHAGLTGIPNAAAGAIGGVPTVDAANGVKLSVGIGTGQVSLSSGQVTVGTLATAAIASIWDAVTSGMTTAGSIGKKLADWILGSDNKVLLSTDAQTGVVLPRVTLVDTTTTNMDMRGTDNAALAATALSTVTWPGTLATALTTLAGHDPGGTLAKATDVPSAATVATAILTDTTASDFAVAGSLGYLLVGANGIETGVSLKQSIQRIGATAAGKLSGSQSGNPSTEVFVGLDGVTTRVTITADNLGNRTAVVYG